MEKKVSRTRAATRGSLVVRRRRLNDKLAIAKPMWKDPAYTVAQIADESGLNRKTLYDNFGPRWSEEEST